MYEWKLFVKKKQISLPIMIGDFEAVTAEGINLVDDRDVSPPRAPSQKTQKKSYPRG